LQPDFNEIFDKVVQGRNASLSIFTHCVIVPPLSLYLRLQIQNSRPSFNVDLFNITTCMLCICISLYYNTPFQAQDIMCVTHIVTVLMSSILSLSIDLNSKIVSFG